MAGDTFKAGEAGSRLRPMSVEMRKSSGRPRFENGQRWRRWFRPENPWPWLGYLLIYFFPWAFRPPTAAELQWSAVALPLFFLFYFAGYRHTDRRAVLHGAALVALGCVGASYLATSSVFVVYGAALIGRLRPRRHAFVGMVALVLGVAVYSFLAAASTGFWVSAIFFSLMTGMGCIFSSELVEKNRALERSRHEVARLAAEAERERIARDLHDLLGHTLSVIAIKSELAQRLFDRDRARARAELADINMTARQALKDIRAAVSGMKETSLAAEIAQARKALEAADVSLEIDARHEDAFPAELEQTLAMLVREGVTNVVRHARARACRIRIVREGDAALLVITDDGRGGIAREGNGLRGMRARVAALGGELDIASDGGTRIAARLPLATGGAT